MYKDTLVKANAASQKIANALARADQLKVRLDLGAQTAKITAMLSQYSPTAVNSKLSKIDEFEQVGMNQLDGYASAAKVAADRNIDVSEEDENINTDPALKDILTKIKSK